LDNCMVTLLILHSGVTLPASGRSSIFFLSTVKWAKI
jgi:hypothetical protein